MAASASDIATLRRLVADPAPGEFSDTELITIIETYPLTTGYDLNRAAADVWEMKAAMYVTQEEAASVDGARFEYGSLQKKALEMQKYFMAKADDTYSTYGFGQMTRTDVDDERISEAQYLA